MQPKTTSKIYVQLNSMDGIKIFCELTSAMAGSIDKLVFKNEKLHKIFYKIL